MGRLVRLSPVGFDELESAIVCNMPARFDGRWRGRRRGDCRRDGGLKLCSEQQGRTTSLPQRVRPLPSAKLRQENVNFRD